MTNTHDEILAAVRRRLRDDDEVEDPEIEIELHEDTVTLSGRVTDRRAIDAALRGARAVDGVRVVVNRLSLDKSIHGTLARSRDKQREVLDELDDEKRGDT